MMLHGWGSSSRRGRTRSGRGGGARAPTAGFVMSAVLLMGCRRGPQVSQAQAPAQKYRPLWSLCNIVSSSVVVV